MKLSEIKGILANAEAVNFKLQNGNLVPAHFHVTEVGMVTKNFIDCGGTVRAEKKVNFQLWDANDLEHRLKPQKLLNIIALSEKVLGITDLEIEVEYQNESISKYGLEYDGNDFILTNTQTACLAMDSCGIPAPKQTVHLNEVKKETACCTAGGGCC